VSLKEEASIVIVSKLNKAKFLESLQENPGSFESLH